MYMCCFALFVCLTLLASFFLPSRLSFKNMYMYLYSNCRDVNVLPQEILGCPGYPGMHTFSCRRTMALFLNIANIRADVTSMHY